MSFAETWKRILRFNDEYFPGWRERDIIYVSNALAGEVGEVCNDAKHLIGGGTNKRQVSQEQILEELADVYIYSVILAEMLGFSDENFDRAVRAKVAKCKTRMNREAMKARAVKCDDPDPPKEDPVQADYTTVPEGLS